jgi:hypothetical protein
VDHQRQDPGSTAKLHAAPLLVCASAANFGRFLRKSRGAGSAAVFRSLSLDGQGARSLASRKPLIRSPSRQFAYNPALPAFSLRLARRSYPG